MVDELRGLVSFFKVGLQLFIATGLSVVKWLREQNLKVFLDMKMEDTEHTILHSVKEVAKLGVTFLTIHGSGITAKVAKEASQGTDLRILSLTLLTSLGEQDLKDLFIITDYSKFKTLEDYVLWRAAQALKFGCDGLIASGQNVAVLRKKFGSDPLIISLVFAHRARHTTIISALPLLMMLLPVERTILLSADQFEMLGIGDKKHTRS